MEKQAHNRNQGKKRLAKLQAKRRIQKTGAKQGFQTRKPKTPSKKVVKLAKELRSTGSKMTSKMRKLAEEGFLSRVKA